MEGSGTQGILAEKSMNNGVEVGHYHSIRDL